MAERFGLFFGLSCWPLDDDDDDDDDEDEDDDDDDEDADDDNFPKNTKSRLCL